MRACLATTGVTGAANAIFQCLKGMFHPRVADLFEAFEVICAAAHSVKILWDERMIGIWQRKPIDWLIAVVTRVGTYRQTNLCPGATLLCHILDISYDNIRAGHKVRGSGTDCMLHRWHHHRLRLIIRNLRDLSRLHHHAD